MWEDQGVTCAYYSILRCEGVTSALLIDQQCSMLIKFIKYVHADIHYCTLCTYVCQLESVEVLSRLQTTGAMWPAFVMVSTVYLNSGLDHKLDSGLSTTVQTC